MKFEIEATSGDVEKYEEILKTFNFDGENIDINSLEHLILLLKLVDSDPKGSINLIIGRNERSKDDELYIGIYDSYRE